MIKLDNISFSYGEKPVFSDLTLEIKENSRICLFGESGCGKTTLLRIIAGLTTPQSGTVSGTEGLRFSAVFQENRLLPFRTVLRNILLIGANRETAFSHLAALGIEESANRYPSELSGGMQRRAAIARALSAEYDILILDEPFSGLDEQNTEQAARHISAALNGRPLIMVSHSKKEAELLQAEIIPL